MCSPNAHHYVTYPGSRDLYCRACGESYVSAPPVPRRRRRAPAPVPLQQVDDFVPEPEATPDELEAFLARAAMEHPGFEETLAESGYGRPVPVDHPLDDALDANIGPL